MSRSAVLLGVQCDFPGEEGEGCDADLQADIMVRDNDTRTTRLGYILDYAGLRGWQIDGRGNPQTARTYCPDHAIVDDGSTPEAPS